MIRTYRRGWMISTGLGLALVAAAACSSDDTATPPVPTSVGGATSSGTAQGAGSSSGGGFTTSTGSSSGGGGNNSCAQIVVETTLEERPPDIIMVVGNNGSLSQEIEAIEANINANFASILEASGIDYRVILISESGSSQFNICVEAPLGGTPMGECVNKANDAQPDLNPTKFFHYAAQIDNNDSWCKALNTYDGTFADGYGLAPMGWTQWLRPEAFKVFVNITDSGMNCPYMGADLDDGPQQPNASNIPEAEASAAAMDGFLLGLSTEQFGTEVTRNYVWHSIVGLENKDPNNPTDPWLPTDDLSLVKCTPPDISDQVVSPALGNQALSRLTGGLRFPTCEHQNFDAVFQQLAQNIISGSAIACSYPVPEAPEGEELDLATVEMKFTPTGGAEETFSQTDDPADCADDRFYFADDTIFLCPEACTKVQAGGDEASLDVAFGCELGPIN